MLELMSLRKRFGGVVALDGLSLTAARGRMLGFLGPNGSGKTTSMRSIFGLVALDDGEVRWDGAPLDAATLGGTGYMPEARGLYARMQVRDQIVYFARLHGMGAAEARAAADRWLERLGLADRAGSRVEDLSHGNQQRVQLIVSLVHAPHLLVLDEPFSGLDPIGVETLGEMVREEARRGAAVIFSSHQLDLVEDLCDDVAIIHRGRTMLAGSLREVRSRSQHRYAQISVDGDGDGGNGGAAGWVHGIEGAEVLWERGGEARVRVPADVDPGLLMAKVREAGDVESFRFEPPALSDLFMEAVR
ncbi:MAG: ATP-binding cassette domain-containing protein [Dehalococcoidia bacterium]|nr:ATP-binding cassette domain-containing protein [Dehalococcoidia bacterium]